MERLKSTTGSLNRRQSSQQQLHLDDAASTPSRPRSASALSGPVSRRLIRSPAPNQSTQPQQPRRVFVVRHGERVDFTFGTWIPFCFDEKGNYAQKDLNMPSSVPRRAAGPQGFALDCPLTRAGVWQARMVGEALRRKDVTFAPAHVYCSPSLRCVQTCHNILIGLGLQHQLKIKVEPGLFEWLMWYMNGVPDWMSPEELFAAGHNVDLNYKPYISAEELQNTLRETSEDYYTRNFFVTQCVLQATESFGGGGGGNVLLVGHAASLDACTRQLTGRPPPVSSQDMMAVVRKVPYCSLAVAEERREVVVPQSATGTAASRKSSASSVSHHSMASASSSAPSAVVKSTWKMVEPPIPPLTHCSNDSFNWNILCGP